MATTYGERVLADVEDRVRKRSQRRRAILVFAPASLATVLATFATVGARTSSNGTFASEAVGAAGVVAYALLLVLLPLHLAVSPAPNAVAAAVAATAGPIAMPMLFAPGWRLWHRAVVLLACLAIIAARYGRRSQVDSPRARGRRR